MPVTFDLRPGILSDSFNDGIVYVPSDVTAKSGPEPLRTVVATASGLDNAFNSNISILPVNLPARRLIYSPAGSLSDYDDVRSYGEAAGAGIKRALSAGVKTPLLVLPSASAFPKADLVTLLGALEALSVPIQVLEGAPQSPTVLSVTREDGGDVSELLKLATILEEGRTVARDIGGGDPERMAAPRIQEYVENIFRNVSNVKIEVIDSEEVFNKEYPLFAAVNRAASVIERHRGRIIYLRYEPKEATETLYLVGKGITYDTGGADIKINGIMAGMSRDKCGAAAVAGFMKVVSKLAPKQLRVVGALCIARNSVGENCYVSDEVIVSRSGARVRVCNTDAEGRMVMADVLCKLKEEAVNVPNSRLFTIATLTGHAALAVGPYSIAVDNSVSLKDQVAESLRDAGAELGDPFEVSRLRREDFKAYRGAWQGDHVKQSCKQPSSRSARGHQGPAAFLVMASGLEKHGLTSDKPLKYSHLDIAGSAGDIPNEPTASPMLALYGAYLAPRIK